MERKRVSVIVLPYGVNKVLGLILIPGILFTTTSLFSSSGFAGKDRLRATDKITQRGDITHAFDVEQRSLYERLKERGRGYCY